MKQCRITISLKSWRSPLLWLTLAWGAALSTILWWSPTATAQSVQPAAPPAARTVAPPDAACKLCHATSTETMTLPSGEMIHPGVDLSALGASVHGAAADAPLYCTDCHGPRQRYQYPHAANPSQDLSQFRAEIAQNCERCHLSAEVHNPGHLQAAPGSATPTCVDCHGGHEAAPVAAMQADPVGSCQRCHQQFEDPYLADVHAEVVANFSEGQSCQSCHSDAPQSEDAKCQTCHSLLTHPLTLSSGDIIELHVKPEDIVDSVHGARVVEGVEYAPLRCTDCHQEQRVRSFPHQPVDAASRRSLTIGMQQVCQECHREIFERNADGVHAQHIAEGNLEAATCTDCHGNHAIHDPSNPRERISQTCGNCHSEINEQYSASVHGAALLGEHNPDVPVCTDCHGVHDIPDPTTAAFRLSSPQMCGRCHADAEMMRKYNISTDVFETYVADFHGATVTLFEAKSPNEETNKAVCYDCHGIHDTLPVTDENSQVIKANLLATCQQCHPDATANFPDSWTSHFKPSLEHNPLVYFVNLFYMIVIPATVGGFLLFIGTDVFRRIREWAGRRRQRG